MATFEAIVHTFTEAVIVLLDTVSVILMLVAALRTLGKTRKKEKEVALFLSKRISVALNFMLCGAILQLLLVRELQEVLFVCAVLVVHFAVSFFVHWEIKHHESGKSEESASFVMTDNYHDDDDDEDDDDDDERKIVRIV